MRSLLVRNLLLMLCFVGSCRSSCSSPFRLVNHACVNMSTIPLPFMDAQTYCHNIRGEVITGATAVSFATFPMSDGNGNPFRIWIGLTDLLVERNTSRNGWRWTSGSIFPASNKLNWKKEQPRGTSTDGLDRDCVTMNMRNISEVSNAQCHRKHHFFCQPRPRDSSLYFEEHSILSVSSGANLGSTSSSASVHDVSSRLECAAKCLADPNGWCASFYFREATMECTIVRFNDALLALRGEDGWRKFSVKSPDEADTFRISIVSVFSSG